MEIQSLKDPEVWLKNNTCHFTVMILIRVKEQVIRVQTGAACGVKSFTGIFNYSIQLQTYCLS